MKYSYFLALGLFSVACNQPTAKDKTDMVQLITLDPGHFHAALVQKSMYPGIDSVVNVYAPDGAELNAHLALIDSYNARPENPTHWKEVVYKGPDFLEKMLAEKKGNVVILAGNNKLKTAYINKSIAAGLNVLGDKPMAISEADFQLLEKTFADADEKKVLLYDIMTERSEITNILQKELTHQPAVFGELEKGTLEKPAIEIESIHHFYKYVSGKILRRPSWFFDPAQQGDAIVDVNTHLVDIVQWMAFDTTIIDYKKDIEVQQAEKWPTPLKQSEFTAITGAETIPDNLKPFVVQDSIINVPANGAIHYAINGVNAKVTALWNYQAPEGGGDSHYALVRGTKANLVIRQGKEENWKPELYIEPLENDEKFAEDLQATIQSLQQKYPGIGVEKKETNWKITIPDNLKTGHEAHFADVMQRYLQFLKDGKVPEWEVRNMIAKYYVTTKGLAIAKQQ